MNSTNSLKPAILFFGPQGCGKGTQAELVAQKTGYPLLEAGKTFREFAKGSSYEAKQVAAMMAQGQLIDAELVQAMFDQALGVVASAPGVILDGFGRRLVEYNHEKAVLTNYHFQVIGIVIDIDEAESIRRLSGRLVCTGCSQPVPPGADPQAFCHHCGGEPTRRADDTPQSIAERLAQYQRETVPVIEAVKQGNTLIRVDGHGTVADVASRIWQELKPHIESFSAK